MVGATHAENDLPEWVDYFRQWHFEMLSILDADELDRVHNRQAWIQLRPVARSNLPTSFEVPLTPFLIPVPPAALDFLSSFSLTLVDNVYGDSSTISSYHLHDAFTVVTVGHLQQLPEMNETLFVSF